MSLSPQRGRAHTGDRRGADLIRRRLPVIDDFGQIVGIVSQADLVAKGPRFRVDRALRTVSKKTRRMAVAPL